MATGSSPPARQQPFKLILGSSSVARKHILEEMGLEFQVMTADIDEKSIRRENPDDLVMVLAEAKGVPSAESSCSVRGLGKGVSGKPYPRLCNARRPRLEPGTFRSQAADAIMSRLNLADYQKEGNQPTLLITSDIVCLDYLCSPNLGRIWIIREKPTTKEEARQFLKGYSGGHVSTVGSVVVTNLTTGKRLGSLDKAEVYFHDIPEEVIESLIDEGVVFRVAGGLLLEHPLTLPFVEAVVGSSDSVMGLSKEIANKLIHDALST
ncbi:maf-like protein DDB_G0281937 isoform X1 [Sorghum bicolor]|uniref:maf-like protein DDB_G0281937 isoform X1 n=1 Tax=Sorghum bicolor TaxID=4558 RepID=UPI000B423AE9|nr:maf-like protein DDB_G0281937 isoform X1 [Sorghum bicolor]|eukprot:XP_021316459.1 maf-like protein DDB_G0281937 isoform X1 [Sorghum bicolor]